MCTFYFLSIPGVYNLVVDEKAAVGGGGVFNEREIGTVSKKTGFLKVLYACF